MGNIIESTCCRTGSPEKDTASQVTSANPNPQDFPVNRNNKNEKKTNAKATQEKENPKDESAVFKGPEQHAPSEKVAHVINFLPEYANQTVNSLKESLSEFEYSRSEFDNTNAVTLDNYYELLDLNGIYKGQWYMGKRSGRGIMYWKDGSVYVGYWRLDKANGYGRMIHVDGDYYEGEWKEDLAHGKGKYVKYNGAVYYGDWVEDKQEGDGEEEWPDKSKYRGSYKSGKKEGHGTFRWPRF